MTEIKNIENINTHQYLTISLYSSLHIDCTICEDVNLAVGICVSR